MHVKLKLSVHRAPYIRGLESMTRWPDIILLMIASFSQTRSHGVAWGGRCHPWATGCHPFATPEDFLASFYCCFVFVAAKERSPKILVEINLGLCNIQENSIFSCIHFTHLIAIA